jgi:sugar phosphate isomerase/epimerase
VENARQLAGTGLVDDMELVLFEAEGYGHNFPAPAEVRDLRAIAAQHDLSYTVHLPRDVSHDDAQAWDTVQRAVDATRDLNPYAYVMHLDGRALLHDPDPNTIGRWQASSLLALQRVVELVGAASHVCLENVERWPPQLFDGIAATTQVARCVDVGHCWVQQADPLPYLRQHLPRARVIHLHGIGPDGRDHQSLQHMPASQLDAVVEALLRAHYAGVLTLEVFGQADFFSSLEALRASVARMHAA